tara:strand:- start:92 stop:397 length:306 start_codon:yes stop_codon:yes gene_type:complete
MGFFCYSKCVLSINEIINGIKHETISITPTKRLKYPKKFNPKMTADVIFPRRISRGIKKGIVINSPRIEPFLRLKELPKDRKFINIRFEITKEIRAIMLNS